jgi:hypothetical protein
MALGRWRRHITPERTVDFQLTTRCYIPEDRNHHKYRYENFKFYVVSSITIVSDFEKIQNEGRKKVLINSVNENDDI